LEEENVLNSVGEMTGIALENIKLYEKILELYEYQRKRREDEHVQLLSLSTRLGSAIELTEVLGHVLELMKDFFVADFLWLIISDNEGNFVLKSATSLKDKTNEIIYRKGINSIEAYSLEKMKPVVIRDIQSEKKFKVFSEEEIHFLEIISNILAVSIERSDLYVRASMEKGLSDAILQSVEDGIITVDKKGKIISINRALEMITDVSLDNAIGLQIRDIFGYTDMNNNPVLLLEECIENALSGTINSKESEVVTTDGNKMAVLLTSYPIFDTKRKIAGAVNLLRNISREKEIDRMKTDIIRNVSHEFRTPLSAIVGMTEMILDGDVGGKKIEEYLKTILSEGIRLSTMVSDLLSIARIESGKEELKFEVIDMKALLHNVTVSFSSLIEKKKAIVKYDLKGKGDFVVDRERIKELLMNLVDNSLTFSDDGCNIEIKVRKKKNALEIMVSDDGWGISEEDLPRLTERFYRGRHGEKIKGTGLGLSLSNEIVKMHDGNMNIKSRPGEGTKIVVSFPYRRQGE
jgi:PAS domain S-box-containing protein